MNQTIRCACGCGQQMTAKDSRGRPRRYVSGHNLKIDNPSKPESFENVICKECHKPFRSYRCFKRQFCSLHCRSKHIGQRLSSDPFYADRQRQLIKSLGNKPPIRTGEKHWNWKGGITPKNARLRGNEQYKQWRIAVFRRDWFTCQRCGSVGKNLRAHHIQPWSKHPLLRYVISNGITFCRDCHDDVHASDAIR
jgi:5-methylcytosine-specific restriction endonuclease McrA